MGPLGPMPANAVSFRIGTLQLYPEFGAAGVGVNRAVSRKLIVVCSCGTAMAPLETSATYRVSCASCTKEFDALTEPWCGCLYKDRTIVCPHCGRCFCTAPLSFKHRFWVDAPPEMWARKKQERTQFAYINPPVETITRPLVLVVDDEDEIRAVAIRAIEQLGLGIVVARDGLEGLEVARHYKPDIIVTDAMMPKLDGREMCLRLKGDPETATARIVVLTSLYTDARYKYEALKTFKADAYLSKPVEPQQLQDVLRKFIS